MKAVEDLRQAQESPTVWWTEHTVREYVKTLTTVLPGESSPVWLAPRRFDIHCLTINLFIEVDGEQHFGPSSRFPGCFRERQKLDAWKMRQALQHEYSTVRVAQVDAASNTVDWRGQLERIIRAEISSRSKPCIWYVAKSEKKYDAHKNLMR